MGVAAPVAELINLMASKVHSEGNLYGEILIFA